MGELILIHLIPETNSYLLLFINSIWGGLSNSRGNYNFPSHYTDGTVILQNDFFDNAYPNHENHNVRWIFGELEFYKLDPPSLSCPSFKLPENNFVFKHVGTDETGAVLRPVVCKGKHYHC